MECVDPLADKQAVSPATEEGDELFQNVTAGAEVGLAEPLSSVVLESVPSDTVPVPEPIVEVTVGASEV